MPIPVTSAPIPGPGDSLLPAGGEKRSLTLHFFAISIARAQIFLSIAIPKMCASGEVLLHDLSWPIWSRPEIDLTVCGPLTRLATCSRSARYFALRSQRCFTFIACTRVLASLCDCCLDKNGAERPQAKRPRSGATSSRRRQAKSQRNLREPCPANLKI